VAPFAAITVGHPARSTASATLRSVGTAVAPRAARATETATAERASRELATRGCSSVPPSASPLPPDKAAARHGKARRSSRPSRRRRAMPACSSLQARYVLRRGSLIAVPVLLVAVAGCRNSAGGTSPALADASPPERDGPVERVHGDASAPRDVPSTDGPSVEALSGGMPDATPDGELDSGRLDAMSDAGPFPCGSSTCAPSQYCVSRTGGPAPRCFPHADGGGCPAHTTDGCSFPPATGGCQEVMEPSFSCQSIPASCTDQEPCRCICSLAPGPMGGCFLTGRQLSCNYP
jgi:hypothetical protein